MGLKSIRWRLPLSYAGIALLSVVALGLVLITILRSYYDRQEMAYMQDNAREIAVLSSQWITSDLPQTVLVNQVYSWSFLIQARIQVLDKDGRVLADSGVPDTRQQLVVSSQIGSSSTGASVNVVTRVAGGDQGIAESIVALPPLGIFILKPGQSENATVPQGDCFQITPAPGDSSPVTCQGENIQVQPQQSPGATPAPKSTTPSTADQSRTPVGIAMTMSNSLFGFILNPTGSLPKNRSPLKAILNLAYAGNPVGSVVLSDGPAYGAEILTEVIRGWWLASLIAVILAAAAGWWVSRRMMAPLITLAGATASMAGGNLSARAVVQSTDEFGELGRSFNTMAERVEEIVGTLRGFVADAAHQLMTPLTALRTNLELASDETNPARRRDYLDNANAQMARMETLVNSLLELSRLEASGVTPARERFDLSQVVRSAAETAASRAEQTGRQFSLALPAGPVALDGDETRIRHALDNLLDNAIKFTPAGGSVRLQLSTAAGWVTLAVEDDGPGIPSEDLPHVFERFHRGMNSAGIPGSGLGLAIVKAIVEIHQGKVIVESTEHGTRVEMRFLATPLHLPGSTRIDA